VFRGGRKGHLTEGERLPMGQKGQRSLHYVLKGAATVYGNGVAEGGGEATIVGLRKEGIGRFVNDTLKANSELKEI